MDKNEFIADLHVHSKFSRATARDLDLENMYIWAQRKGISVIGTGDFTHPAWFSHILEKLEPAENGLFRLKPDIARHCDEMVPSSCKAPVRFMLTCEISNIYKKKERTRKNHNLVFFPDLDAVQRFNSHLAAIGNTCSDGRPILGLDARDLLEIVLETSDAGYLVPAHIWTPWFSMLGSKSGFDSLEACFDDLSEHIFAAETGLSSDPAMNWRVSHLDGITLVSNSDAHSPSKLGREANIFGCEMDYFSMRHAMQTADPELFLGTFEFYPEEGKYHVDGHRKCNIRFVPEQTQAHGGRCPVCGKPLTLGVLHRVEELATRAEGIRPGRRSPFHRLIPLENLLAAIFKVGEKTKTVARHYHLLNQTLGSEFRILHELDYDSIDAAGVPLLAEAIVRMRAQRVSFSPGFDGLYGTFTLFSDQERKRLMGQRSLFAGFDSRLATQKNKPATPAASLPQPLLAVTASKRQAPSTPAVQLNAEQNAAVSNAARALIVIAGPGTGKTRTLTHKIADLIESAEPVGRMLAVTFTNRAAVEMRERLSSMLGASANLPFMGTFHGLGFRILRDLHPDQTFSIVDEQRRRSLIGDAIDIADLGKKEGKVGKDDMMGWIATAKQRMLSVNDDLDGICPADQTAVFKSVYAIYEQLLRRDALIDFEDLIFKAIGRLTSDPAARSDYIKRFDHIFIDEFQDINAGQYRLIRLLTGDATNLTVIGDPDQAIYGFRGSDTRCFDWFFNDYPDSEVVYLRRNYRSSQTILEVSAQVIGQNPDLLQAGHRRAVYSTTTGRKSIHLLESASETAEAVSIGKAIEKMIGGTGFFSIDSGAVDGMEDDGPLGFSDFAILFRTRSQADPIAQTLEKAGIPCQFVDRRSTFAHSGIQAIISLLRLINGSGMFDDLKAASSLFRPALPGSTLDVLKRWAYAKDFSMQTAMAQSRRIPLPELGVSKQQRLYGFINRITALKTQVDGMRIVDAISFLVNQFGLDDTYVDDPVFDRGYRQLMSSADASTADGDRFLADLSLFQDQDTYDHRVEKVSLMTLHAAKGLEFPVVFIAGCEDGLIPYHSEKKTTDPHEERRLFYVGLTRAAHHLYLTWAGSRLIHGKRCDRRCSTFVNDIEKRYIQTNGAGPKTSKSMQQQLPLFR